jgi:hypothetical protein
MSDWETGNDTRLLSRRPTAPHIAWEIQVDRTFIDGPLWPPLSCGVAAVRAENWWRSSKGRRFDLGYLHTPGRVFSASGYAIPTKPSSRETS